MFFAKQNISWPVEEGSLPQLSPFGESLSIPILVLLDLNLVRSEPGREHGSPSQHNQQGVNSIKDFFSVNSINLVRYRR
jgi:hypothetical protein